MSILMIPEKGGDFFFRGNKIKQLKTHPPTAPAFSSLKRSICSSESHRNTAEMLFFCSWEFRGWIIARPCPLRIPVNSHVTRLRGKMGNRKFPWFFLKEQNPKVEDEIWRDGCLKGTFQEKVGPPFTRKHWYFCEKLLSDMPVYS